MRGIRLHFPRFIKELKEGDNEKAQLGLAHGYSRAKVKFNVDRVDNMIIQSICLLDQLDKDLNTFAMRVRYGLLSVMNALRTHNLTIVPISNPILCCAENGTHGTFLS